MKKMKIAYLLPIANLMGIENPAEYLKSIGVVATDWEPGKGKGEVVCTVDKLPDPMPIFIKEVKA